MKEKKLQIVAIMLAVLTLVLGVIEKIILTPQVSFFWSIIPCLAVAAIVFVFLGFKGKVSFTSKWFWIFILVMFTESCIRVAEIPRFFVAGGITFLGILRVILSALGILAMLLSAFFKKNHKMLLYVAFGILSVLEVILCVGAFEIMNILTVLFYVLFALLISGILPKASMCKYLLIVLAIITCEWHMAIAFIVLVFLFMPGFKIEISGKNLVAALCVITAIVMAIIPGINTIKTDVANLKSVSQAIKETEEVRQQLQLVSIEEYEEQIEKLTAEIAEEEKELETAKKDSSVADSNRRAVCSWSSYYEILGCDASCKELHEIEKQCDEKVNSIVRSIQQKDIDKQKAEINIESVKKLDAAQVDNRNTMGSFIILLIRSIAWLLLATVGLLGLAICFYRNKFGKLATIFGSIFGGSVFLSMFWYPTGGAFWPFDILNYLKPIFIFNACFWQLIILSLFALILTNKNEKNNTTYRTCIIFSSVIMMAVSLVSYDKTFSGAQLFAITTISAAFLLVPFRFTEYIKMSKHIFLYVFTAGIWNMIWIYNVTKNLNKVSGGDNRNPVKELLLCIFLPFYIVYWTYKTAEIVEIYGAEKEKQFKITIPCISFMFVCPVVSVILLQNKINDIVGKPE